MATGIKPAIESVGLGYSDGGLAQYVKTLLAIDTESPAAKENAISIADNNGGRILL